MAKRTAQEMLAEPIVFGKQKLNEGDVRQIRAQHGKGVSAKELADEFDVTASTIYDIVAGRTWSWLP